MCLPPTGQTSNDALRELIREARAFCKDGLLYSEAASFNALGAREGDLVRKTPGSSRGSHRGCRGIICFKLSGVGDQVREMLSERRGSDINWPLVLAALCNQSLRLTSGLTTVI